MRVPYSTAAYTYLNFSEVFQDYFNSAPADVVFKYRDFMGADKEIPIPNAAKLAAAFGSFNGREFIYGTIPPLTNIDPEHTGTIYIDVATGSMYICTDKTPSFNVWRAVISTFDIESLKSIKPTLSGPTGVTEELDAVITITNYQADNDYIVESNIGSVEYNYGDNYLTFTAPAVISNTGAAITVKAFTPGMLLSNPGVFNILITDSGGGVPPNAEQIINNDLAGNMCASYM